MENTVKEKIAKILELSQRFQMFMGKNENVVRALNELNKDQLTEIWGKLNNNPNQEKINKVRLQVVNHLLEKGKITNDEIIEIKDGVAKAYPDKKIFQSWDLYFRLFLPILYRDKIKTDLECIADNIIDSLSLKGLVKYKVVDFDGATNLGLDRSWIAIYNKNQPNQKVSYQLYVALNGQVISYGLNRHMDKKSISDNDSVEMNLSGFNYNEMISFLDKYKKIIIEDNYYQRYWKFSPGVEAKYWEQMRDKGIATIGWGDFNYVETENIEDIINLRPEYFKKHNKSPAIINQFNDVNIGDVIYVFKGVTTLIARGVVTSTSKYSDSSMISDPNGDGYYNFVTVDWFELPKEIIINKEVSRNTIVDVTVRHEEFEKMIHEGFGDKVFKKSKPKDIALDWVSLNQILYGPPGTGKTYNTVAEALKVLVAINVDEDEYGDPYSKDKSRFDALKAKGHIEFITFHQSFSYEDFVEGIRAETNDGGISYSVKDGIFKKIAIEALFSKLELSGDKLEEAWKKVIDTNNVIVNKKITPEIKFDPKDSDHKKLILAVHKMSDFIEGKGDPYVLIIDEINRGNTSRIFGELITLIESTKRAGSDEAMDAVLPYSQETFTVPDNLYIIGTMNTADRSLALIDTALRRRFDFIEMMPDVTLIINKNEKPLKIGDIDIQKMLQTINDRIEVLYDREHTIGHAFFMKLTDDSTIRDLASVFRRNILPLLEEYFFEDWKKICQVLGKSGIYKVKDFKEPGLSNGNNYSRDEKLLAIPETYINIYKDTDSTQQDATGSS